MSSDSVIPKTSTAGPENVVKCSGYIPRNGKTIQFFLDCPELDIAFLGSAIGPNSSGFSRFERYLFFFPLSPGRGLVY